MRQTFRKNERLHRKILIKTLFDKGVSFFITPFRITWLMSEFPSGSPVQLLISVPRHNQKNAVDRNLLKRRMREAFRKNKKGLYEFLLENQVKILVCITYTSKEIVDYRTIQEKIIVLLQRLKEENAKTPR
jgi:ribonuclease P protein component